MRMAQLLDAMSCSNEAGQQAQYQHEKRISIEGHSYSRDMRTAQSRLFRGGGKSFAKNPCPA